MQVNVGKNQKFMRIYNCYAACRVLIINTKINKNTKKVYCLTPNWEVYNN